MEALDCADPSALTPKRNVTLTAIQALAMLNDPLVLSQARNLAERIRMDEGEVGAQLTRAFWILLGREPRKSESRLLVPYASEHGLEKLCLLLFNSNEFMFVD